MDRKLLAESLGVLMEEGKCVEATIVKRRKTRLIKTKTDFK